MAFQLRDTYHLRLKNEDKKASPENRCSVLPLQEAPPAHVANAGSRSIESKSFIVNSFHFFSHLPHLYSRTRSRPYNKDNFQAVWLSFTQFLCFLWNNLYLKAKLWKNLTQLFIPFFQKSLWSVLLQPKIIIDQNAATLSSPYCSEK